MKIYLARHGEYEHSFEGELSRFGEYNITKLRNFLRPLNLPIKKIYQSGVLRAQQTADILATAFSPDVPVEYRQGLNPVDDIQNLLSEINTTPENLLVVGHLPFMNKLIGKMVNNEEHQELTLMQPGTMLCLDKIDESKWIIEWMISPQILPE